MGQSDSNDPTGGSLTPPHISEMMGWSVDDEVPPSIKMAINNASAVRDDLLGKINNHITDVWANAAVGTDLLANKIGHQIGGVLANAQTVLQRMQHPIATDLVGHLTSAGGVAGILGVNLPMPGETVDDPHCVQIRQAGLQGSIDPAVDAYRIMAWPQRFAKGINYVRAVNWITSCLPADEAIRESFAEAVNRLETLPESSGITSVAGVLGQRAGGVAGSVEATGRAEAVIASTGGRSTELTSGHPASTGLPVGIPTGCLDAVARWAAGARDAFANCNSRFAGDITAIAECVAQVASDANGAAPVCAGGTVSFNSSGGMVWTPGGVGIGPGVGGFGPQTGGQQGGGPAAGPAGPGQPGFPSPGGSGSGGGVVVVGPPYGPGTGGGGSGPTSPGCDPATIVQFFTDEAQAGNGIDQACADFTATFGLACYPTYSESGCDSASTLFQVPANAPPGLVGVCIACSSSSPPTPPTPPTPGCPPVNIVVNCPPGQSLPTQPSGSPPPPPKVPEVPSPPSLPGESPASACDGLYRYATWLGDADQDYFRKLFNSWILRAQGGAGVSSDPINGAIQNAVNTLVRGAGSMIDAIVNYVSKQVPLNPNGSKEGAQVIGLRAFIGFLSKFLGPVTDPEVTSLGYAQNSLMPYKIPSNADALAQYLSSSISIDRLKCIVEANGDIWSEFLPSLNAARTKLSPGQYGSLYMREVFSGPQFQAAMQALGFTDQNDINGVLALMQQLPAVSDIISMMMRDAADTVNIDWSKEDAQFPDKYKGPLRKWGEQQGIPEEYMMLLWRAHFSIPSPTQLYEMLHRLARLPAGDPKAVNENDIRQALIQQDISPKWVDRLMAVSYKPLTRIDASRAYKIGVLGKGDLVNAYLDLGYSPDNAATLADFQARNAGKTFLSHWAVRAYVAGGINANSLEALLKADGADDDAVAAARDKAREQLSVASQKDCVAAIKKRFLIGDLDSPGAESSLTSLHLDADQVGNLMVGWRCERQSRGKAIPAATLCRLYQSGAIDAPGLTQRLQRVGYSFDDAVVLARQCAKDFQKTIDKQQAQQLKQQQQQSDKLQRQQYTAANRTARQIRQAQQAAIKAQNLALARTKRLQEASLKFQKLVGGSIPDAVATVNGIYKSIQATSIYTQDEIIQALLLSTGNKSVSDTGTLLAAVQAELGLIVPQ